MNDAEVSQTTTVPPAGDYSALWEAKALVTITPLVGGGEPFQARIHLVETSSFTDEVARTTTSLAQRMFPAVAGRGFQVKRFQVGPGNAVSFQNQIHCHGS